MSSWNIPDIRVRGGSEETINFHLKVDGEAFDLTSATEVVMRRSTQDDTVDVFSTEDGSPLLTISDATAGELAFTPADGTVWDEDVGRYAVYFVVTIASQDRPFPESENIFIQVFPKFAVP